MWGRCRRCRCKRREGYDARGEDGQMREGCEASARYEERAAPRAERAPRRDGTGEQAPGTQLLEADDEHDVHPLLPLPPARAPAFPSVQYTPPPPPRPSPRFRERPVHLVRPPALRLPSAFPCGEVQRVVAGVQRGVGGIQRDGIAGSASTSSTRTWTRPRRNGLGGGAARERTRDIRWGAFRLSTRIRVGEEGERTWDTTQRSMRA
ncbi:hypothetical protein DFH09DRAFT_154530 [Mycena vulgaris]|nr:hypothetical protein DFH09DRAFT_154530 [Mycena vulgaris]